jgi:AAA ATPase domain
MATRAVIGRDKELAAVRAFLDQIEDGPCALVLSGEAGIGKTILWEAGLDEARERGATVLTCRGAEAEASLSFAGLSELLGGVLDEVEESLAPPRRRALEVALLLSDPGDSSLDPHAVGLAVLDVLRALAGQGQCLSRSTTCSGSTPPPLESSRLRSAVFASSRWNSSPL